MSRRSSGRKSGGHTSTGGTRSRGRGRSGARGPGPIARTFSAIGAGLAAWSRWMGRLLDGRWATAIGWTVLAAGVLVLVTVGIPWLEDRVADSAIDRTRAESGLEVGLGADGDPDGTADAPPTGGRAAGLRPEIRFRDAPPWFSGTIREDLLARIGDEIALDPFDRSSLERLRGALVASGCFGEVRQVRRVSMDSIEVDARFLEPWAVVQWKGRPRMIDPTGIALPARYEPAPDAVYPVIRGTRYEPPAAGERWDGGDVAAALAVARLIEEKAWARQVSVIDVHDFLRDQPMILYTDRGNRIVWRSAPGEEQPGEVSAAEKLRRLDALHERTGRIDEGLRDATLDVTGQAVVRTTRERR